MLVSKGTIYVSKENHIWYRGKTIIYVSEGKQYKCLIVSEKHISLLGKTNFVSMDKTYVLVRETMYVSQGNPCLSEQLEF